MCPGLTLVSDELSQVWGACSGPGLPAGLVGGELVPPKHLPFLKHQKEVQLFGRCSSTLGGRVCTLFDVKPHFSVQNRARVGALKVA